MNYREFEECMEFCGCATTFGKDTITVSESGSVLAEIDTSLGSPAQV